MRRYCDCPRSRSANAPTLRHALKRDAKDRALDSGIREMMATLSKRRSRTPSGPSAAERLLGTEGKEVTEENHGFSSVSFTGEPERSEGNHGFPSVLSQCDEHSE